MKLALVIKPEGDAEKLYFKSHDGEQMIRDYIEKRYKLNNVLNEIRKDVEQYMIRSMVPDIHIVDLEEYKKKRVGRVLDEKV